MWSEGEVSVCGCVRSDGEGSVCVVKVWLVCVGEGAVVCGVKVRLVCGVKVWLVYVRLCVE